MLSRFVIAFLTRSKGLLISQLQLLVCSDFGAKENKICQILFFVLQFVMKWGGQMPWSSVFECWVLSQLFHSPFLLSSTGSLVPLCFLPLGFCHLCIWGLLILLLAILSPAWDSSSLAFHMMYSAQKLNMQGDNIQPRHTPFPILNQSIVLCLVLTAASWPAYRFLKRQVRWSGIPISWRSFQFVVIHTVKGFSVVNEAEVDVFLEFLCFFYNPTMLAIWSLVLLPFLNPAYK